MYKRQEISNTYGVHHVEERLCVAASGALHKNRWQKFSVEVDFYTLKGVLSALLESLGFDGNRVRFKTNQIDTKNFHPYRSAEVYLGKELLLSLIHIWKQ